MSADTELESLRRWKAEALPVIFGLQDLGRALGLRPGMSITGPAAVEAAKALRAKVARVEALDLSARRLGMAFPDPWREGWNRALEVGQDDLRAALADETAQDSPGEEGSTP